jgi:hypothetical protein
MTKKTKKNKALVKTTEEPKVKFDDIRVESGRTGASTKVFVNGQQVLNACVLDFHAQARGLNTLTLVVYPKTVKINGEAVVVKTEKHLKDLLDTQNAQEIL